MDYEDDEFDKALDILRQENKNSRIDTVTNKMGEYLLKGWCMLEESCGDCNCPLMGGKKGELVCCGCGKDYSKSTPTQAKTNKDTKAQETKNKGNDDEEEIIVTKRKDSYRERNQITEELPNNDPKLGKCNSSPVKNKITEKSILKPTPKKEQKVDTPNSGVHFSSKEVLKNSLSLKLESLCKQLENQTDLYMIDRYLDTISKTVNLLRSLD